MDVLNKDFRKLNSDASQVPAAWQSIAADCEINFCLAHRDPDGNWTGGIERTLTTVSSWPVNDAVKFTSNGGADAWDRAQYLNIWVCNISGNVLGYSSIPAGPANVDGVVLDYEYTGITGATAPYDLGRTATHEIGHWLNLLHVWGDDGNSCSGSDGVADTPNQAGENYGCPAFPHTDPCSPNPPGVMFMNFMDYTDDACMYIFTAGQKTRIWAFMNSATRLPLQVSNACTPTGIEQTLMQGIFSISPSPTTGAFTLNFTNGSPKDFNIIIYTVLGEQIFNNHYDVMNQAEIHLDLEGNPAGIYLVEVHSSTGRFTKKIMLE
ncbi:MAG: M43 family zinc metalloprotease [Bacteroidota bacterium]|nr:M43 family zinc metalloprotease [Bacteroidota bacterium]